MDWIVKTARTLRKRKTEQRPCWSRLSKRRVWTRSTWGWEMPASGWECWWSLRRVDEGSRPRELVFLIVWTDPRSWWIAERWADTKLESESEFYLKGRRWTIYFKALFQLKFIEIRSMIKARFELFMIFYEKLTSTVYCLVCISRILICHRSWKDL